MNDLGFIVGHPTQFESPFYQYVTKEQGAGAIKVYFYEYATPYFNDPELGKISINSYGIDLLSGYSWVDMKKYNLRAIINILKQNKYVIANGYTYALPLMTFLIAKIMGKKIGIRMDTVPWNNTSLSKKITKKILLLILNPFIDVYWVTGTKTTEYLRNFGISPKKILVFSYVIDEEWFKQHSLIPVEKKVALKNNLNIPKENKIIVCVTKLIHRESPIDLIKAFDKLKLKNVTLLIIGDGEERGDLENNVRNELKNNQIVFAGFVKYTELPSYYAIADLFVHPSMNEPWGVSVQEAMSCGLPVIASNFVGAAYDLISSGQNGFIYEYGNIDDLSEKLNQAIHLDLEKVKTTNQKILNEWNFKTTWQRISNYINNDHTENQV
jgi:glycosyltransferase involved in cell wall biosynthesis